MDSSPQCLIIGGGIAGLWLLSRLRDTGIDAWLLEKDSLGSGQTLASQGIIHGGIKYSLSGKLTGATKAISAMPERWQQHMLGQQLPNLNGVQVLAKEQYMLTQSGMRGRLLRTLVSSALSSDSNQANLEHLNLNMDMTGLLVQENIIDTRSLMESLHGKLDYFCRQYRVTESDIKRGKRGWSIMVAGKEIRPRFVIFAAGEGNDRLIGSNKVQLRPLHMVCIYHPELFPVYAHVLEGANKRPLLTISSHYDREGNLIWYIGGDLAETGNSLYSGQQSMRVEQQLRRLWPHIDWGHAKWLCLKINRAEHKKPGLMRPEWPDIISLGKNAIAVFPTKLTFVPLLGDQVVEKYKKVLCRESQYQSEETHALNKLPLANIGHYPWG